MTKSEETPTQWKAFTRANKQDPLSTNAKGRCSAKEFEIIGTDGSVRYMCDQCGNHYKHYRDLIRHRYQCLQKKVIVCVECSKTFFRSDALTIHMRKCHNDSADLAQ